MALVAGCDTALDSAQAPTAASSHGTVEVVTEADIARQPESTPPTNNWVLYTRTPASVGTFVSGPASPPAGIGSFHMETPTGGDKLYLFNYDHIGLRTADIDGVSYSTYRSSASGGSGIVVPSINLEIDRGRTGEGYAVLVYEPYYNASTQGPVADDVWQDWDAYDGGAGRWWATRDLDLDNNGTFECPRQSCFFEWGDFAAGYPDATVLGAFGVNQGSGNPVTDAFADALALSWTGGAVTYDFEPYRVATDKDACKSGGWEDLRRADGSTFRNQGQCIRYVNTGR
ncbi:hypothetical protein [Rubrivirga sp. IMCC43871]|uniref:hypothetical protein n=1 Tax=Rubrivirga sp. IMCC43871 TaxID=3391575 RepID=UPI00398FA8B7